MSDEILIKVENVSKKFCRSLKRSMLYGIEGIARDLLHLPSTLESLRGNEIHPFPARFTAKAALMAEPSVNTFSPGKYCGSTR